MADANYLSGLRHATTEELIELVEARTETKVILAPRSMIRQFNRTFEQSARDMLAFHPGTVAAAWKQHILASESIMSYLRSISPDTIGLKFAEVTNG